MKGLLLFSIFIASHLSVTAQNEYSVPVKGKNLDAVATHSMIRDVNLLLEKNNPLVNIYSDSEQAVTIVDLLMREIKAGKIGAYPSHEDTVNKLLVSEVNDIIASVSTELNADSMPSLVHDVLVFEYWHYDLDSGRLICETRMTAIALRDRKNNLQPLFWIKMSDVYALAEKYKVNVMGKEMLLKSYLQERYYSSSVLKDNEHWQFNK